MDSWEGRRSKILSKMKSAGCSLEWNLWFDELKKLDAEVCEDSGDTPCGNCYGCVRHKVGPF